MKTKRTLVAALLCATMVLTVGCGGQSNTGKTSSAAASAKTSSAATSAKASSAATSKASSATTSKTSSAAKSTASNAAADEVDGVSLANPIKIDKEAKTVTVLCSVNGQYFTQPTRHASVFKDGSNGTKSIFTAYGTALDFYDALIAIGAKEGGNMTVDNKETTHVEGDPIKCEVTWNGAGKYYDYNEVIIDSNKKPIEMRFGGNRKTAEAKNTGCLSCLDSCPVGIVSNTTYTYGAVETRGEVGFTGNADILPEDGTYVAVKYTLEK